MTSETLLVGGGIPLALVNILDTETIGKLGEPVIPRFVV